MNLRALVLIEMMSILLFSVATGLSAKAFMAQPIPINFGVMVFTAILTLSLAVALTGNVIAAAINNLKEH